MIEIIEILLTSVYFLEYTVVQCKDALSIYWNRHGHECSRIWKLSANFHAHSVHQNSVEIFWAEIYRGRLYFRAEIYRGRLLTLITGSSSRLLRIRFSADHALVSGVSFPVHEIEAISDMDLESKYIPSKHEDSRCLYILWMFVFPVSLFIYVTSIVNKGNIFSKFNQIDLRLSIY